MCCDCDSKSLRALRLRCTQIVFGRLTTQQRGVFILLMAVALGFSGYYLNYVVTKAQFASSNPSTVLLSQSITNGVTGEVAFPGFQLQVYTVYSGRQSCSAEGEVWIQTGYPMNNTLGRAVPLNLTRWNGIITPEQPYSTAFTVTVPSVAWSIANPMGLTIRVRLVNWDDALCGLQLGVTSIDDLAPSHWAYSSSADLRTGRNTFVALQGSVDEHIDSTRVMHVQSRFTASEPIDSHNPVNSTGPVQPTRASVYVMNFNEGTLFALAWRKQVIDYGWQDGAAALLAVLNVAWGVLSFLFPNAVYAPHQRTFFRDIPSSAAAAAAAAATATASGDATSESHSDSHRHAFVAVNVQSSSDGTVSTPAHNSSSGASSVSIHPLLHSSHSNA